MKKTIIAVVAVIICIGLVVGAVAMFNDIFPKTKPIRCPEAGEVIGVSVAYNSCDDRTEVYDMDLDALLEHLREAQPTRSQSLDDYPSARPYYLIRLRSDRREYSYFIYESGTQVYIEMPYEGIYKSDEWVFNFVLKYFEEA